MVESPVQTGTTSNAGPSHDTQTLRDYLGSRSVLCPSCGYDVHGCDDAKCPECAWPLSLQLKPRTSFVSFWVFSLMINGWLFLWGFGGSFSMWLRAWQFHSVANRRLANAASQAQAQALIQQFTGRSDAALAGGSTGVAPVPVAPTPTTLVENFWTYFVSQSLLDQVSVTLFLLGAIFGGAGLLITPWMKRLTPRANAWLISASIVTFSLMMANYIVTYLSYLARAL